jgi:hypothetical protein
MDDVSLQIQRRKTQWQRAAKPMIKTIRNSDLCRIARQRNLMTRTPIVKADQAGCKPFDREGTRKFDSRP